MKPPKFYLISATLLLLILLTFSWLPTSFSASDDLYKAYENCQQQEYTCGDLTVNVSYPFRVNNRPDYCGKRDYFLVCISNKLMISINSHMYRVLSMDYDNHFLNMVDDSFTGEGSCVLPKANTSIDFSLYMYSDRDSNLTIYSNCTSDPQTSAVRPISCSDRGTNNRRSFYKFGGRENSVDVRGCSSTYVVAVDQNALTDIDAGNISSALKQGFSLKWTAGLGWCRNCTLSGGLCGVNIKSPADQTCYCPYGVELGRCIQEEEKKSHILVIGLTTMIGGILAVCTFIFLFLTRYRNFYNSTFLWKKETVNAAVIENILKTCGSLAPKRYTYAELKKITKSFSEKLGHGGYGVVFKGILLDGHQVAVKLLRKSKGNGEEFINEVSSIGRTSHVNIVCLVGFCLEGSQKALIYDFMPNGSLEKYTYPNKTKGLPLSWEKLHEIAIGVARGLEYLHRGCNTRIVHFDIKPHNILLDENLCPKISDFGLSKLCIRKDSILSMADARGTIGYIAPEVFSRNFGTVSSKSDVYSYGMMVLEMVGGRTNVQATANNSSELYFPHWIYEQLDRDGGLQSWEVTKEIEEIAKKMIIIGLWCIQTMPINRPSISRVVEMLSGSINDLKMPPKPYLASPEQSVTNYSSKDVFQLSSTTEEC